LLAGFLDWIDERISQLEGKAKAEDLEVYRQAKAFWESLAKKANAKRKARSFPLFKPEMSQKSLFRIRAPTKRFTL